MSTFNRGCHYKPGDHYIIDDRTGRKIRRSDAVVQWDGLMVHRDEAEDKHPQLDLQPRQERIAIVDGRSEAVDQFVSPGDVTGDDYPSNLGNP